MLSYIRLAIPALALQLSLACGSASTTVPPVPVVPDPSTTALVASFSLVTGHVTRNGNVLDADWIGFVNFTEPDGATLASAAVDEEGLFSFAVPAGTYNVELQLARGGFVTLRRDLIVETNVDLDFDLDFTTVSVAGFVSRNGDDFGFETNDDFNRGEVVLSAVDGSRTLTVAVTGQPRNGVAAGFDVEVVPGSYSIVYRRGGVVARDAAPSAIPMGRVDFGVRTLTADGNLSLDVVAPVVAVAGRVVVDGAPLPDRPDRSDARGIVTFGDAVAIDLGTTGPAEFSVALWEGTPAPVFLSYMRIDGVIDTYESIASVAGSVVGEDELVIDLADLHRFDRTVTPVVQFIDADGATVDGSYTDVAFESSENQFGARPNGSPQRLPPGRYRVLVTGYGDAKGRSTLADDVVITAGSEPLVIELPVTVAKLQVELTRNNAPLAERSDGNPRARINVTLAGEVASDRGGVENTFVPATGAARTEMLLFLGAYDLHVAGFTVEGRGGGVVPIAQTALPVGISKQALVNVSTDTEVIINLDVATAEFDLDVGELLGLLEGSESLFVRLRGDSGVHWAELPAGQATPRVSLPVYVGCYDVDVVDVSISIFGYDNPMSGVGFPAGRICVE